MSGARCRFAYGPADATATHSLLLIQEETHLFWFYISGTGSPGIAGQSPGGRKTIVVVVVVNPIMGQVFYVT